MLVGAHLSGLSGIGSSLSVH